MRPDETGIRISPEQGHTLGPARQQQTLQSPAATLGKRRLGKLLASGGQRSGHVRQLDRIGRQTMRALVAAPVPSLGIHQHPYAPFPRRPDETTAQTIHASMPRAVQQRALAVIREHQHRAPFHQRLDELPEALHSDGVRRFAYLFIQPQELLALRHDARLAGSGPLRQRVKRMFDAFRIQQMPQGRRGLVRPAQPGQPRPHAQPGQIAGHVGRAAGDLPTAVDAGHGNGRFR